MTSVRVEIDDIERGDLPALSVKTGRPCANPVAVALRPKPRPWSAAGPKVMSVLPIEPELVRSRRRFTRVSWVLLVVAGAGLLAALTGAGSIGGVVAIVAVLGYALIVATGERRWVGARPGVRPGELVLTHVHRAFANAVDAQYGR
jgi:hypothetical protein